MGGREVEMGYAKSIIDKHTKEDIRLGQVVFSFTVAQTINGKAVEVVKPLPVDAAALTVDPSGAVLVKPGLTRGGEPLLVFGPHRRVTPTAKKAQKSRIKAYTKQKYSRAGIKKYKTVPPIELVQHETVVGRIWPLNYIDRQYVAKDGSIITTSLSKTTRQKLQRNLLDSKVSNLIATEEYDESALKPLLDFNYVMSKDVFRTVKKKCSLNESQWAEILSVPEDRIKSTWAFNHQQSMHILKVLLLFNHGIKVMSNKTKFKSWLKKKNKEMGDTPPYFYLDSPSGINVVHKWLLRIDHGIFA